MHSEKLPAHMEIKNLEHRLAFWKQKEANLYKMRRTAYYLGLPTLIVCLAIIVAGTILTGGSLLIAAFLTMLFLVLLAFIALAANVFNLKLSKYVVYGTEGYSVFVKEEIAECETRLAELRTQQ